MLIRGLACVVLLAAVAAPTLARQGSVISVVSTNAITGPLLALAESHRRETGTDVKVEFDTSPSIGRRLASGDLARVDVLIAATAAVDQAVKDGKAMAGSRAALGKVGVGVVIRRGARRPDISSADAVKASMLSADAIMYSQGTSGVYVEKLLQNLGIAGEVKGKTVQTLSGDAMLERLAAGRGNEVGFTQVSEIMRADEQGRVSMIGPLPAAIQYYTEFDAVVMSGARAPDAARAFVRALTAPAARKVLAANGWEF
jgi:molybdate transport system substrate-binding protein